MFREPKLCVSERLLLNARQVIMEAILRIAFGLGSAKNESDFDPQMSSSCISTIIVISCVFNFYLMTSETEI